LKRPAGLMPMIRLRGQRGPGCYLRAEEQGRGPPGAARGLAACSGSGCSRAEWQEGGGSQPYLGARAPGYGPGHMMMDWVSPCLQGDAAAHSFEAVRGLPCTAGHGRSDRGLPGAGRGGAPSDDEGALAHPFRATGDHPGPGHAMANASSPSSPRMWHALRTILRASDRAARLPPLRSLTAA